MKSRDEILTLLRKEKASLLSRWPIASLALFGSVARGEQTEISDVDILIELSAPMGWDFFDLESAIATLLGLKVDLIPMQGVKPNYMERITPELIEVFRV